MAEVKATSSKRTYVSMSPLPGLLQTTLPVLRNQYAGQEASRHEQRTGSKLGKGYIKAVYCHSAYLTYMQNKSCKMPG